MDYFLAVVQHKEVVGALFMGLVVGALLGANLQASEQSNSSTLIKE